MGPECPCTSLLGVPRTHGPDYSVPRPFLRVVYLVTTLEG